MWVLMFGFLANAARAADRQFLHYQMPAAATNAAPIRSSSRWQMLPLTIALPLRDREGLTNLLAQLYDPASPNFRRYLSPDQFAQRFAPTEEDYQAVVKFAKLHGLIVTGTHPNRTLIDVRGTVGAVERAFHVTLNDYQHPTESRTFYAPDRLPSLDLTTPVLSVGGLDNYAVPHPCSRPISAPRARPQAGGSGPGGTYLGNDFRAAYAPGVTLNGAGQMMGLVEYDSGYYQSDIDAYEALADEPPVPVTPVLLDGYGGGPGNGNSEVSLDIEMAIAMAPGLDGILVYEGSTADDILNRMATDDSCKQLAASWTYPIDAESDQIFMQFAAQGQSFFNASGDGDAYTGTPSPPTDDPNITVVGGTTLTTFTTGGAWESETVWNDGGGQGSGGGISTDIPIPTWQEGIDMSTNGGSTTFRNLPDVAFTADNIWVTYGGGLSGGFVGTSCAVQLWGAFTALINQEAVSYGNSTVGFINPAVYAIGKGLNFQSYTSLFHDITTGNNEKTSSPNRFAAVPGYDLCTGWGTPAGGAVIMALALPEPLQIAPPAPANFTGPAGGPFGPAMQTFTLTNGGPGSVHWSLANTSTWFSASPMSGTVVQGGPADTVTVSVTSEASNLSAGNYSAALRFTNLGDHIVQTRQLTLAVVAPPVITVQPTNEALLEGMTAVFTVGVASNALLNYQWMEGSLALHDEGSYYGTSTSSLIISNIASANVGTYSVVVSNAAGAVTSSNAVLTYVQSAPVVVLQPVNLTAFPGSAATFSVGAIGTTPYKFQWQFNGTNLANNSAYSGVTTKFLTVTNIAPADGGTYTVTVGNYLGSTTSTGAVLSVVAITVPGLSLTALSDFAGASAGGGAYPYSPVVQDTDGNFYGTTPGGGENSLGAFYKATPAGGQVIEYSFKSPGGVYPYAGVCLGANGAFYGATEEGGLYNDGTLFKITTTGTLNPLVAFDGNNGEEPFAGLVLGSDGNFYGTSSVGGANGYGTIFRMTPSGALTTLVSFDEFDGANASPVLIQGTDGNFYGTTETGGDYLWGNIFRMSPSGDFTNLYSFTGGSDGGEPVPGLVQAADGNFYGATIYGGSAGYGAVFEISSSGVFTSRYSFNATNDGANPWGGLVQAADGNLYGTAQEAGAYGFGTVFRLAPSGQFATVAQFDGFLGSYPSAALIQGKDGNLYGTTVEGGLADSGVIYKLAFSGPLQITGQPTDQTAYFGGTAAFTVATFGGTPVFYQWRQNGIDLTNGNGVSGANAATLTLSNVTFYDAAYYTVVVSNSVNSDTSEEALLGVIYSPPLITSQPASQTAVVGMTVSFTVGVPADQPVTYQWQENGTNLADGGFISGSATSTLTLSDVALTNAGTYSVIVSNSLSGVSSSGAALTVVPATPSSAFASTLHFFNDSQDGAFPYGGLVEANDGNLYGTAEGGGQDYFGSIFRLTLGGIQTGVYSFPNSPEGANPAGSLVLSTNGNLFGSAAGGGVNTYGAIYRMTTNPVGVKILYSFTDGEDGATPIGSLVQGTDGNFYGTAYQGGDFSYGSVFQVGTDGTLNVLYDFFGGYDGGYPYSGVIQGRDGTFYGTALEYGFGSYGTVFNVDTNGDFYTLASFDGSNGAYPQAGLIQGLDGNLYGSTFEGGTNGYGTIFCVTTNGALTTIFSFNYTNGAAPAGALVQASDGNFYGTTAAGGPGGQGTVFRITTNGTLSTLMWFDGLNGADPEAPLVQASDGNFYGTTAQGGTGFNPSAGGGNGTTFRLTVPIFITNSIPVASAVAPLPYSSTLSSWAVAPAGDALSFAKVSGPAWLLVATNGVLSGTPANANIGTNIFSVSLTDTNGVSASASLVIPVTADPPPAFIVNPFAEPAAGAGEAYSGNIATNASDAELGNGDILTFAKAGGPAWLNVAANGMLSGTPAGLNIGTNTFVVSVANLGGATNGATLNINVTLGAEILTQISEQGTNLVLTWSGGSGPYQVLMTTNLENPDWQPVGPLNGATNLVVPLTNVSAYYQIQGQ
jgi:uncharacterized repeat protein (TIGR03803 family)